MGQLWVSIPKFRVVKNHPMGHENIIKDQIIALQGRHKGLKLRRVEAWVEVDGKWRAMVCITNNMERSPRSVCDLYRRRWDIEVFFKQDKQDKQSLKLGSFLAHSDNAVRWQVYTALLVCVLLRFMAHLSGWGYSFTRLFAVTRWAMWERIDLVAPLKSYGAASPRYSKDISTTRKKLAIGIPPKPSRRLANSRLRARYVQTVGRRCSVF